ncbi:hypothetical protein NA57DRAFT_34823 [Rhizodiscina lignyota]|uniref:Fungal N-terminal domain-containing protein n=1 Tax=Rhizodiscina lignyota TaxID=1504668 RepID=A0A9P4IGJ9_9PEZI|nr:hypothetical protein NA57DRAFT_34823 [Rhizodiscina lignyota]
MSFGFSVGDFITAGELILKISKTLREAGGARSDFQELVRELGVLRKALQHLDRLPTSTSSTSLDSIKYAALSCRQPLEAFLLKINRYEVSLGTHHNSRVIRRTVDKLKWEFVSKAEVQKLRGYLEIHVGTINILLAEHGLERMSIMEEKAESENLHIRERLDGARAIVEGMKGDVSALFAAGRYSQSMLTQLSNLITCQFMPSWRSFTQKVTQVCVCTQQIYGVVLEIRQSLQTVDTRWTYFQAPFVVEDALRLEFPIPSEYDFGMIKNIIQYRFREGTGALQVRNGNYKLFRTEKDHDVITEDARLLPGTVITMAIYSSLSVFYNEERQWRYRSYHIVECAW